MKTCSEVFTSQITTAEQYTNSIEMIEPQLTYKQIHYKTVRFIFVCFISQSMISRNLGNISFSNCYIYLSISYQQPYSIWKCTCQSYNKIDFIILHRRDTGRRFIWSFMFNLLMFHILVNKSVYFQVLTGCFHNQIATTKSFPWAISPRTNTISFHIQAPPSDRPCRANTCPPPSGQKDPSQQMYISSSLPYL